MRKSPGSFQDVLIQIKRRAHSDIIASHRDAAVSCKLKLARGHDSELRFAEPSGARYNAGSEVAIAGQTAPRASVATFMSVRIAHLSDIHLMTGPLAAQPAAGLAQALARLLSIKPRPDCVIITGDLADTGHPEEYAALHAILRRCPVPVHLTTGNHDDPASLAADFGGTRFLGGGGSASYVARYPEATVIVADSQLDGSQAGYLGPDQLGWIEETLAARPSVPALVCLHHPPLPLRMPFLDGMRLPGHRSTSKRPAGRNVPSNMQGTPGHSDGGLARSAACYAGTAWSGS